MPGLHPSSMCSCPECRRPPDHLGTRMVLTTSATQELLEGMLAIERRTVREQAETIGRQAQRITDLEIELAPLRRKARKAKAKKKEKK